VITSSLLRLSGRLVPLESDEVLRMVKPASFPVVRIAADCLSLALPWRCGALAGLGLALVLGLLGSTQSHELWRIGGDVGLILAAPSGVGVALCVPRFVVARVTSDRIEDRFLMQRLSSRPRGLSSEGEAVEVRAPVVELLTKPRDLDVLLQLMVGLLIANAAQFH
jgi:hypothetical protein